MIRKHNIQLDKYRLFIKEYISNGFNGSAAYAKTYNRPKGHITEVEASNLLSKPVVFKIYQEELAKVGFDVNAEWIMKEIVSLFRNGKKEQTKSRMLELLSKIKAMYKESSQSVAVFTGLEQKEQAIVNNRLTQEV